MKRLCLLFAVLALAVSCAEAGLEEEDWRNMKYQTIYLAPDPDESHAYIVSQKGGDLQILAYYQGEGPTVLNERMTLVPPGDESNCSSTHLTCVRTRLDDTKALYSFHFEENTSGTDLVWGVELVDTFTFRDKGFALSRFMIVQKAE